MKCRSRVDGYCTNPWPMDLVECLVQSKADCDYVNRQWKREKEKKKKWVKEEMRERYAGARRTSRK